MFTESSLPRVVSFPVPPLRMLERAMTLHIYDIF